MIVALTSRSSSKSRKPNARLVSKVVLIAQSTTKKGRKVKQVATQADFLSEDNLMMHEIYNALLDTPVMFRDTTFKHVAEEVSSPNTSQAIY